MCNYKAGTTALSLMSLLPLVHVSANKLLNKWVQQYEFPMLSLKSEYVLEEKWHFSGSHGSLSYQISAWNPNCDHFAVKVVKKHAVATFHFETTLNYDFGMAGGFVFSWPYLLLAPKLIFSMGVWKVRKAVFSNTVGPRCSKASQICVFSRSVQRRILRRLEYWSIAWDPHGRFCERSKRSQRRAPFFWPSGWCLSCWPPHFVPVVQWDQTIWYVAMIQKIFAIRENDPKAATQTTTVHHGPLVCDEIDIWWPNDGLKSLGKHFLLSWIPHGLTRRRWFFKLLHIYVKVLKRSIFFLHFWTTFFWVRLHMWFKGFLSSFLGGKWNCAF